VEPIRDPQSDALTLQTVEAAIRTNDLPRAVDLARSALSAGLDHPLLYNLRAYWLESQGRNEEALADLLKATALDPQDPLVQNSLGLCLTKMEKWEEAIAAFQAAARLKPDFSHAHFNLGWAQERIGELVPAERSYARAHEIDPGSAEPIARLAALATRRVAWNEAETSAKRALAVNPRHALAATALVSVSLARKEYDAAERQIDGLLGDANTPPFERTLALSLLGDLRHAQKRYSEAFSAYSTCNEERRKMFAPRYEAPGVESALSYVCRLTEYFEQEPAEAWNVGRVEDDEVETKTHAFLVGFPRSGTTLLENVLASNREIVSLEEKQVLADSVRAFLSNDDGRQRLKRAQRADLTPYRQHYWRRVRQHGIATAGKIFVDKEPLTSIKLPLVARLFPRARILFAIRDPRDVVLSCFRRQFTMNPSMYEFLTIEGAARFYAAVMNLAGIYREKFALAWHVVRHEAIVDDFDAEVRAACAFLGADWTEDMRLFVRHAEERPIATPSAVQVTRGLNSEGIGQWRNYANELAPAMIHLRPWIDRYGYPPK
jgi:tetratricopeptide (TPR) repeat protein